MDFNKEAILNLFNDFPFEDTFTSEDNYSLSNYLRNIKGYTNFHISSGASKCVIIPEGEDYVIKIPYTGQYIESDWDEEPSYYEDFTEAGACRQWDYCQAEAIRYEVTAAVNLNKYFAPTIFIGYTNFDFPIYIQPKCEELAYAYKNEEYSSSMEEKMKTSDILNSEINYEADCNMPCIPLDWLTSFRFAYGEDELIRFLNFLRNEEWGDFRDENIGFFNGRPIVFDYSDFWG